MLKAAIFDLDGTLYDYEAAHAPAFRALAEYARAALSLSPERFEQLHREAFDRQKARAGLNSAGIHSRLVRCQLILEEIGRPISHAPKMAEIYWAEFLRAAAPFPDAAGTLERLKAMGLAIGVGTNMTAYVQYLKLEKLGLMPYVDFMVTSEEAGAEKPDRRFFDLCAGKAGCGAGECAFVGDSLRGDVLGALDAGMRAFWLCVRPASEGAPPGAAALRSLAELPERIALLRHEGA